MVSEYFNWLKNVFKLNLGRSLRDGRDVYTKIMERLPATLELSFSAFILTILIGFPLGIYQAYKINSKADSILTYITFIFYSIPNFWLGLVLAIFFGVVLPDFTEKLFHIKIGLPTSGRNSINFILFPHKYGTFSFIIDKIKHSILPAFTYAIINIASIARYIRSNMSSILKEDFINAARAKGVSEKDIILKHALKNSVISSLTFIGFLIPSIIGSSFIIEVVFSWPGIGRLGYNSILSKDYPVVMAIGLIISLLTMISNLIRCYKLLHRPED
jgi:peptide/nickel transport system permease protein